MSTVLKFRRGDTTASNAFIGQEGELFVDTTKDTLVVHNGVTSGGNPLATEAYVGSQLSSKQNTLVSGSNIKSVNGQSLLGSGNITISGGGSGGLVYAQFADNQLDLTTTAANQVIDSYPASLYRSSKYIIQAVCSGVGIHSTEVVLIHDGSTVYITEYGTIYTATSLFTVNGSISGTGDLELSVTPANANTSFDIVRTSLAARTYEAPSLQGDLMTLTGTEDLQTASGSLDLNV